MTPAEFLDKLRIALNDRRYAYQKTFNGPLAEIVLKDLARFCRAHESTFNSNDRAHVLAEGRREVWLRLQHHLKLTPDQLWDLYSGGLPKGE
jgi:hypothetical protein